MHATPARRPRVWTVPVLLGVSSAAGLIAALVADGIGDAVAWLALGVPVAVPAWFGWFRRSPPRRQPTISTPEPLRRAARF